MHARNLFGMSSAASEPITADRSAREALIRDLYAIAAFYVAHPEHPLPDSIMVFHHVPAAVVVDVADQYGTKVYGDDHAQTDHKLTDTKLPITLVVSIPREDKPL